MPGRHGACSLAGPRGTSTACWRSSTRSPRCPATPEPPPHPRLPTPRPPRRSMSALKVLFIGGTGRISTASARLAVERGLDAAPCCNRGTTTTRPVPDGVTVLRGDIRDPESARAALRGPRLRRRRGLGRVHRRTTCARTSTCSAGGPVSTSSSAPRRPTRRRPHACPLVESTPLRNPFLAVLRGTRSRARTCSCRRTASTASRRRSCARRTPTTSTHVPFAGGWTVVERMIRGQGGRRPRRRDLAVDPDPPHGLRQGLRAAAGPPADASGTSSTSPATTS